MRAYSLDLRERVLADCDAGHSNDEVAEKYHVSAAWIRRSGDARPAPWHPASAVYRRRA
jgi:transposase